MDTLQKKLLGWAGIGLMILAGMYLVVKTNQESNTATTTNTVSFSGEGKVLTKPDIALVDLSIVTEATNSKAAQDDNSKRSNAVTEFLKKQGVAEKDIKTTSYNIYPQYDYSPTGRSTLRGYQVSQTIRVKVRDLDKADDVLAGVVAAGANQINSLQLTVDDPEKLKAQAREDAIKDAQAKAKELQGQLGIDLGRIVNFTESGNGGFPPPMYFKEGIGGGDAAQSSPALPTGENEISVSVTITYQIR